MEEIKKEDADYQNYEIPKFYTFKTQDEKERILYANFIKVGQEVRDMVKRIYRKPITPKPKK